MNKLHLLHEAEKLYCVENLSPEMIAEKLNISRRTIFNWKKKHNWDNHIVRIKDFSKQFAGDIYNVGTKLLAKLNNDIENHRNFNKHEICTLENIIKIMYKKGKRQTLDFDNYSHKNNSAKILSPDVVEEINRESTIVAKFRRGKHTENIINNICYIAFELDRLKRIDIKNISFISGKDFETLISLNSK